MSHISRPRPPEPDELTLRAVFEELADLHVILQKLSHRLTRLEQGGPERCPDDDEQ